QTPMDTLHLVMGGEPVPPSRLARVPADLETICLKCLQKDPRQRYASAEALADDLARFLREEPVLARPVGNWKRLAKFVKRRPALAGLVGASALAALAVVGLVVGSFYHSRLQ